MLFSFSTTLLPELSDLQDIAARIASAGYDGIEWRVHPDYHVAPAEVVARAPQLRDISQGLNLRVPCLAAYLQWSQITEIEQLLEAAKIVGAQHVRLAGFVYEPSQPYARQRDNALTAIHKVVPLLRSYGVGALIETHFGTIHASALGARQIVEHFDPENVGVIFDAANQCVEGREDWALSLDILGPWLRHVHVRNTDWSHDGKGQWRWQWSDLATGQVPWATVFALLESRGYTGFATSENLWGVAKRTTGYINEIGPFMGGRGEPRTIEQRLDDITFLRHASR